MNGEDDLDQTQISFFKLAERYEMARRRHRRWRDRRDTIPARRRRRRGRRRDLTPSRHYQPMKVDAREARRGIHTRLAGAMLSAAVTVVCLISILLAPAFTLSAAFALTVALTSAGLSASLIMSARDEELVHQTAGRLAAEMDDEIPLLPRPSASEDGSLESVSETEPSELPSIYSPR